MTTHKRTSIYVEGFGHANPVPAACRIGPLLYSGAITGRDPDSKQMPGDLDTQCVNVFGHVRRIVEAAGGTSDDIIKMTVYLSEFRNRTALNREWERMFPDPDSRPARHALSASFDEGMLIQCEFVAVLGDPEAEINK